MLPPVNEQPPAKEARTKKADPVPPYIAFATMTKLFERMREEGAPPNVIDRSYLASMSGGYQGQVLAAFKVYKLINERGEPTDALSKLVESSPDDWPRLLDARTQEIYRSVLPLAGVKATQGQLERAFREAYGLTGSTMRKAIKFYLDISRFVSLPLSPHWRTPPRPPRMASAHPRPSSKVTVGRPKSGGTANMSDTSDVSEPTNSLEVQLASGGSVGLTISVDLFTLSGNDRDFIFDLVDRLHGYRTRFVDEGEDQEPPENGEPPDEEIA